MQQRTGSPSLDRKREAADRYLRGESAYEIAADVGVSETTIRNWLNELGVPRRSTKEAARMREAGLKRIEVRIDAETKREAVERYRTGQSYAEAGKPCGVSGPTVRTWRIEFGVEPRSRSESSRLQRSRRDAPLVKRLLEGAGACGSPTCADADCKVEPRHCHRSGCDRQAVSARRTDAERHWVRGRPTLYCGTGCAAADMSTFAEAAPEAARLFEQWCADKGYWTREQAMDFLLVSDSSIEYYEKAGVLVPVERKQIGVRPPRPAYAQRDVKRAARTLLERSEREVHHFFSRDYVLRWANGKGLFEQASDLLVRADERRRRARRVRVDTGRPKSSGPPDFHYEWDAMFQTIMAELTEAWEFRPVDEDPPPTKWEVALLVAQSDYERHPERWDYSPDENRRQAKDRVLKAIKALQIAQSETPS